MQELAEMRLKNSYTSICMSHDTNFKLPVLQKTKEAKIIGQMSKIGFDYDINGELLDLRVREQYDIGSCKIVSAKHLVLPKHSHIILTHITILVHCKIGESVVACNKPKI